MVLSGINNFKYQIYQTEPEHLIKRLFYSTTVFHLSVNKKLIIFYFKSK